MNKLLDDLDGRPLYRHALDHIAQALGKDALIVVTQRTVPVPARIAGKPVVCISLNRLWGVALP